MRSYFFPYSERKYDRWGVVGRESYFFPYSERKYDRWVGSGRGRS
jgi:hypothetical protein